MTDFSRNRLSFDSFQRKSIHFDQGDILDAEKISKVYIYVVKTSNMNDLIFRFFAKKMLKILKERIQNRQSHMGTTIKQRSLFKQRPLFKQGPGFVWRITVWWQGEVARFGFGFGFIEASSKLHRSFIQEKERKKQKERKSKNILDF